MKYRVQIEFEVETRKRETATAVSRAIRGYWSLAGMKGDGFAYGKQLRSGDLSDYMTYVSSAAIRTKALK